MMENYQEMTAVDDETWSMKDKTLLKDAKHSLLRAIGQQSS